MSNTVLDTMPPGMVGLLLRIDLDPHLTPDQVHGPMLKGLTTRGLVRIANDNRLLVTWFGQQALKQLEDAA